MPLLRKGNSPYSLNKALLARDTYHPTNSPGATEQRISLDEVSRRSCGNAECESAWMPPWRSRRRPIFEGQWGCSGRCVLGMVRAALRREAGGQPNGQPKGQPHGESTIREAHRHRVPLGLVILAQGWITHPQLQAALKSQRETGSGKIGDWLVSECGLEAAQVTRALSVQWSCPVLSTDGFSPCEMALVMPHQFVAEFGLVPLRVAGGRMLYLGCEDRLNASVAFAVEQMSGLRVESGLVEVTQLQAARTRLLASDCVATSVHSAEDEDALAAKVTAVLFQKQPLAARLVRMHQYYWLRMWMEGGTKGNAGNLPRSTEDMQDCIFTVGGRS